ncbi:MAG: hypothetical protein D6675_03465 [Gemmatimonadetes bacterium]|nr:MAG: hypothetical protein D6675_03465 [Gemmatimonadota bacterium]
MAVRLPIWLQITVLFLLGGFTVVQAAPAIPADVATIFANNCTDCHAGDLPDANLRLSADMIFSSAVGKPSRQMPGMMRIKPGDPAGSYLMMKIRHDEGIQGEPMPLDEDQLAPADIEKIAGWIASLSAADVAPDQPEPVQAFAGWTVGNTPTAKVLRKGEMLFRISHRFVPVVNGGENQNAYDVNFGLDGPAVIMISLGYAPTDNLLLNLGRTNAADNVEFNARYRILRETSGQIPVSLAIQGNLNWESQKVGDESRLRGEVLKYSMQAIATKALTEKASIAVVPGILINSNSAIEDEDPLLTLGVGGRYHFGNGLSLTADWLPIFTELDAVQNYGVGFYEGDDPTKARRFDSWTVGVEKQVGGHVFQLFFANSPVIATDQVMNGGDLDVAEGDMRLGFAIYRILR